MPRLSGVGLRGFVQDGDRRAQEQLFGGQDLRKGQRLRMALALKERYLQALVSESGLSRR